jgi:hypothetical protein
VFEEKLAREFSGDRIAAIGRPDLGVFSFEDALPPLRQVKELGDLVDRNSDWLDANASGDAGQAIDRAIAAMQAIESFDPRASGEPSQIHDRYIRDVVNAAESMKRVAVPLFGRDLLRDLSGRTSNLDAQATELGEALATARGQADAIDAIYRTIQPKGAAIGSKRLSDYYESQGKAYAGSARWSLVGAAAALAAVALVAINPEHKLGPDVTINATSANALIEWLVAVGPRLVLGGLGLYAMRFFVRLYSIQRHLEAVNLHRRNALDTFVLYGQGSGDGKGSPDTAEAQIVLTALAGAIFRDPETGFIPGADPAIELGPLKIG